MMTVQPTLTKPAQVVRTQPTATSRPVNPVAMNASRVRLGLRLGVNSSLISGLDFSAVPRDLQPARVTGFHAGTVLNIGGPTFSVQPELLFSQYGIRMTSGADYVQLKYNLLELPILFKASFGQPNLRIFINAGPVLAYTMSGTASLLDAGQSDSGKIDLTGTGRLSYGASGGSGVALKAGPGAVQLEARYTYLFSSNENNAKVNPQNFMVSVGYLFPL